MNKDVYGVIANFVDDDRTIINMLLVNKKFNDPIFFERIFKARYPLLMKYKDKKETWKQFYLRMIKYLSLIKEKYTIPYIPTKDFNPEAIYKYLIKRENEGKPYDAAILNNFLEYYTNIKSTIGHTIARVENDKIFVDSNIIRGESMQAYFNSMSSNEISIDVELKDFKASYLAVVVTSNSDSFSSLFNSENEAIEYLYHSYTMEVEMYIVSTLENSTYPLTREQIINEDLSLEENWADRDIFEQKLLSGDTVTLTIDTDFPNRIYLVYYYKVIQCVVEQI